MTNSKKPQPVLLYLVLVIHCVCGGLFAFCFNYLFLFLSSEPVGTFVCGAAGAMGSFTFTFFTIAKSKKSGPKS